MRHARENQKREWSIEVLRRLGWTQAEIGEAMGVTKQAIQKQVGQLIPDSVKVVKTQIAKTHQIEPVAEAYNMPMVLATALDLDPVREDGDRAKQIVATIRPHDAWMGHCP